MKRISIRQHSLSLLAVFSLGVPLHANASLLDSLSSLRSGGSTSTSTGTSADGALTLTYTPANWPQAKQGDLFLPADNGKARPVVLLLHGGAWQRGDKSSMSGTGRALAERGYAAFAINYRFAPGSTYPAQLQDMQEALRFLQQNAARYRLDMNRLGAWGYSAGGHLATLLAVQPISDLPPVRVAIAGAPPSDLADPAAREASSVKIFMGGSYSQLPALYEQASPRRQVRPGMAPVFLYHGTADTTVPPVQTQNFVTSLQAAGVPVQVKWLQGLSHGQASGATTQYRPLALDFLDKHISTVPGTVVAAPRPAAPVVTAPVVTAPSTPAPAPTGGTVDRLRALLAN